MDAGMKLYYDYAISPLGTLFYRTVWKQLEGVKGKTVLDFGSGFGFTTNFLAKNNIVTAVELDPAMIEVCDKTESYTQIQGGLEKIREMPDESFDFITCHLVFEFTENPKDMLKELVRVLKKGGQISIVRHNRAGRIIQAIVQDYDFAEVETLLGGGYSYSSAFGDIRYYDNKKLLEMADGSLEIEKVDGVRVLASLHDGSMQAKENWVEDMLNFELKLLENQDFVKVAYFNHVILTKI